MKTVICFHIIINLKLSTSVFPSLSIHKHWLVTSQTIYQDNNSVLYCYFCVWALVTLTADIYSLGLIE